MLYAFKDNGDDTGSLLEMTVDIPAERRGLFQANASKNSGVPAEEILLWSGPPIEGKVVAIIADGTVVSAQPDLAWTPPPPPPDPLEELRRVVDQNILASEHDRRWLAQKEAAKRLGIPWLKANPAATLAETENALAGALMAEFPGEPLVVSPAGVILSYAKAARERGYIAEEGFTALRDLVAATPDNQLAKLLVKL